MCGIKTEFGCKRWCGVVANDAMYQRDSNPVRTCGFYVKNMRLAKDGAAAGQWVMSYFFFLIFSVSEKKLLSVCPGFGSEL